MAQIFDRALLSDLPETSRHLLAAIGIGDNRQPVVILVLFALLVGLALAFCIAVLLSRRRTSRIAAAEAALAKTFGRERMKLRDFPADLQDLDARIAELMRDHERLRKTQAAKRVDTASNRPALLELLGQMRKDAIDDVDKISTDRDFEQIDAVLRIRQTLAELGTNLSRLEAVPDLAQSLRTDLSSDAWNAALTTPAVLEAYFGGTENLKPLSRRLRAIEQVLNAAFLGAEVEIVIKRPFETVSGADSARTTDAPRNLLALRAVQEIAAKKAHAVPDRSPIVVDCFAPGWNSIHIGSRAPRFTIYNPGNF